MSNSPRCRSRMDRREFLKVSALGTGGMVGAAALPVQAAGRSAPAAPSSKRTTRAASTRRRFADAYEGDHLNRVAFPLGGIGAGMICLEGTGALSHVSVRHRPEVFHEPCTFAALGIQGQPRAARVLEGPVPGWKLFGAAGTGNGASGSSFGLPRFRTARFQPRFPFATVTLSDPDVPVGVELTAWSPFEPGDPDSSSLPLAALEYRFTNLTKTPLEAVFSFNARNFMGVGENPKAVRVVPGGFVLWGGPADNRPWEEGAFAALIAEPGAKVNAAWFRGGWWDPLTMAWKDVQEAVSREAGPIQEGAHSPGGTVSLALRLEPKASRTVRLQLAWYVPKSNLRIGRDPAGAPAPGTYQPHYAARFNSIEDLARYWTQNYGLLREKATRFSNCFHDTTLPPEAVEAVAANLTILKSPTVMRQADGRLWSWEGCSDSAGCCHGSCTHVWNYAQAIPHLFPTLERTLRETEFGPSQNEAGHQQFRTSLPIRPVEHDFHAAADGQLGGIMKVHREWRISGDTEWLRALWPKVRRSLDYCIETWDPNRKGILEEPHHNTYDIEFWGPDGMCTSFYLGALAAAVRMGRALGDDVKAYDDLLAKGTQRTETELFDGEYFIQKIEWKNLRAGDPTKAQSFSGDYSPEARALLEKEGPKYQYGKGCLADGVLGSWMAAVCGVGQVLHPNRVVSHLRSVHRYNLRTDLSGHSNPQRPAFACGAEGGLLICTWPKGGQLSLPFVYSDEVWTGIEYQVASHLMLLGRVQEGLDIVRVCRQRYDGRIRNPFNEYECGHWYARALSSYAILQGLSGARYDAVEKVLYLQPTVSGDFRAFLSTATGYGTVGVRKGKPFFQPAVGQVEIREIRYTPCSKNVGKA